nr:MAG TPA: hypothetical protein [Caudoviricetes sp.]
MASYACLPFTTIQVVVKYVLAYSVVFRFPFVEVCKQVEINIPLLAYHIYYMCLKLNVSTPERSATSEGIPTTYLSLKLIKKKNIG